MSLLRILQRRPICCREFVARLHSSSATTTKAVSNSHKESSLESSLLLSSCPADTKLEGVNFLKGQAPVLALSDDKYPEWLWTILKPKVYTDDQPGGMAERVKRRAENKQRIKDRNFMLTQ